jgi:Zn-dependent protease
VLVAANDSDFTHLRFWSAVAFLGFLQITAAVLNLLPIPGLDGYAIIEPYLDAKTRLTADRIKPWGMIGVILLLQFQSVRNAFFNLVNALYSLTTANEGYWQFGRELFKFWVKNPQ